MSALIRPVPRRGTRYQAHPVADRRRRELDAGEWEYGLVVRAAVAGVALAGFLLVLPFVGLVAGAALGIDMAVTP